MKESLVEYVARLFDADVDRVFSPSRKRELVNTRVICMWMMRQNTKANLNMIGDYFGGRKHCTVLNALTTFYNLYATDRSFRGLAEMVKNENLDIPFSLPDEVHNGCRVEDDNLLIL